MRNFITTLIFLANVCSAYAQQGDSLTADDYAHAERFMSYNTQPFVDNDSVIPHWLPGDKFWYRVLTAKGSEFILVDSGNGTRTAAFDQQKVAEALSKATGQTYRAFLLPFDT